MNKGKRLMPEDLLQYVDDLNKNHPDPSAEWGGGGSGSIRAGNGITITGVDTKTISVNNTVAMKTDLPTVPTKVSELQNDTGYITGITSSDVTTALGYTPGTSNFSGSYNDLTNKPDLSIYAQSSNLATVATSGSYNDLTNTPTITNVEANPSGVTPTATLTSLEVGSTVYSIPSGGSESTLELVGYSGQLTAEQYNSLTLGTKILWKQNSDPSVYTDLFTVMYEYLGRYEAFSSTSGNTGTSVVLELDSIQFKKSAKFIGIDTTGNWYHSTLLSYQLDLDSSALTYKNILNSLEPIITTSIGGGYQSSYTLDKNTFSRVNDYYVTTDTFITNYYTNLIMSYIKAKEQESGRSFGDIRIFDWYLPGISGAWEVDQNNSTQSIVSIDNGPTGQDTIIFNNTNYQVITPLSGHYTENFYNYYFSDYNTIKIAIYGPAGQLVEKVDKKFIPLVSDIPDAPTTDGSYHLECTVSNGQVTYTWVLNSI